MKCEGITKKNEQCKNNAKTGKFCRYHGPSEMKQMSESFDGTEKVENLGTGDSLYIPDVIDNPNEIFQLLQKEVEYFPRKDIMFKIFDKIVTFQRDIVFYANIEEDGTRPIFRYGLVNQPIPRKWTKTVELIRDTIGEKFKQMCKTAIVNRYKDNEDYIGAHKDRTTDLIPNSLIFSVSFGSAREFLLQNSEKKQYITLQPGSVFILGPRTNSSYKHSIVRYKGENSERISITLRSVKV